MQFPRSCLATSVVDGKIYVIGGSAWKGGTVKALYNRVDEYDPATGKWTKKADMPTARSAPSSCVLNNWI